MYAPAILAGILALAEPGVSQWSRIALEPPCDPECYATVQALTGHPVALDYAITLKWEVGSRVITWPGYTRAETRMEGMRRFVTIARALDHVARHPPKQWQGSPRELYNAEASIVRQESALWRGVHEGRIRGPVGEACLMQVHPGNGYDLETLVGVDLASTIRCLTAGAEILSAARVYCEREFESRYRDALPVSDLEEAWADGDWFPSTIALYGSGVDCDSSREFVAARLRDYERAWAAPLSSLDFDALYSLTAPSG